MGSATTPLDTSDSFGRLVKLSLKDSAPPTAAYVSLDDQLWVMISTNAFGFNVSVNARLLLPDGSIVPNLWTIPVTQSRAGVWTKITLPECFILSIGATCNVTPTNITTFVSLNLARSQPSNTSAAQLLAQGYTYNQQSVSWPGGINTNAGDARGNVHLVVGTTPAAGANISESVPFNAKWSILTFRFTLACSAAVANRTVWLQLADNSGNVFAQWTVTWNQVASATASYTFAPGFSGQLSNGSPSATQFPVGIVLPPAYQIQTAVLGLQAGDQLSAPSYLIEEWLYP